MAFHIFLTVHFRIILVTDGDQSHRKNGLGGIQQLSNGTAQGTDFIWTRPRATSNGLRVVYKRLYTAHPSTVCCYDARNQRYKQSAGVHGCRKNAIGLYHLIRGDTTCVNYEFLKRCKRG